MNKEQGGSYSLSLTFCCHMHLKVACWFWVKQKSLLVPPAEEMEPENKFDKGHVHSFTHLS